MIDYHTYCQIRHLALEKKLTPRQIARELKLNRKTVRQWVKRESFQRAPLPPRASKLDSFKGEIIRLLERHAYSAQQIFQQIQEHGFDGQYTIVKSFVRQVRPQPKPAFLTLHFAPGECAQVDWGCAGSVPVGSTQRRLSFFVMVLAFSRKMYLEFTLAEKLEHFLACHQRAFEYFGGVVQQVWVDNCKVAVLHRAPGVIQFHPRYLDLAHHYGFHIRACGVGQPQEKGRVESGVGYVKKNFLNGLELSDFTAINPAARSWLDQVANVRVHGLSASSASSAVPLPASRPPKRAEIGKAAPASWRTPHAARRAVAPSIPAALWAMRRPCWRPEASRSRIPAVMGSGFDNLMDACPDGAPPAPPSSADEGGACQHPAGGIRVLRAPICRNASVLPGVQKPRQRPADGPSSAAAQVQALLRGFIREQRAADGDRPRSGADTTGHD